MPYIERVSPNTTLTVTILVIGVFLAIGIFLVVRSLGKPVELPKEKPARKPVPARQPRGQRDPRPPRNHPSSGGRQLAPDDDIEFLRSLNTRPPQSD